MIRKIRQEDKDIFLHMAEDFYHSEAVLHPIPKKNHQAVFEEMMRSEQYAEGYIIQWKDEIAGYGLLSKMFSQEAGGIVVWIEEVYVLPEFQGKGLGNTFFEYIQRELSPSVTRLRLEVEQENTRAVALYKRLGFKEMPYLQMVKEIN